MNFVLIWLVNHDAENKKAMLLAGYLLPILMMSPQGQANAVVIQLEPALQLIAALGSGTLHRGGTAGCSIPTGSGAHFCKTVYPESQQPCGLIPRYGLAVEQTAVASSN